MARTREGVIERVNCRVRGKLSLGVDDAAAGQTLDRRNEPLEATRRVGAVNAILTFRSSREICRDRSENGTGLACSGFARTRNSDQLAQAQTSGPFY